MLGNWSLLNDNTLECIQSNAISPLPRSELFEIAMLLLDER